MDNCEIFSKFCNLSLLAFYEGGGKLYDLLSFILNELE